MNVLRIVKRTLMDIPRLLWGFIIHAVKKKTPRSAHQSLINLFCLTGGITNKIIALPIKIVHRPYKLISTQGVLGNIDVDELNQIERQLNKEGFYVFKQKLPENICQQLLAYSYTEPATIRGDKIQKAEQCLYQPQNPQAVRYDYNPQSLIDNELIQKLMTDHSIIAVAQKYLKTKPMLDVIGMWWHTAYQEGPDSASAQYFHFDMDRIKWLKFFIYLTDVNPQNGPHVFVRGSHRNKGIPKHLRLKGYARLTDEEIMAAYHKEEIIHHIAQQGTIIAEDTRGLHKGQHVEEGDRLVLQLQFSNHMFGAQYPKYSFRHFSDELRKCIASYPRLYSNYK